MLRSFVRHALFAALLLALAAPAARAETYEPSLDLTPSARALGRVAACLGDDPLPEGVSASAVKAHCKRIARSIERYDKRWLSKARPFFEALVPVGLPETVVYPFGGADLMHALAVFPKAREITTISLERTGDPRVIEGLSGGALTRSLASHAAFFHKLVVVNHNRTIDLAALSKDALPAPLIYALLALRTFDKELVRVRAFTFTEDGGISYVVDPDAPRAAFDNVEIMFRSRGVEGAPMQVFRHVRANLDDEHLADNPGLMAHLRAKGKITAMTKAASYLLWRDGFSTIRGYLFDHMAWMISDSTGPAPVATKAAGFEQRYWGTFTGRMFAGPREEEREMVAAYAEADPEPAPFFFGYPDKANKPHFMITYPAAGGDATP